MLLAKAGLTWPVCLASALVQAATGLVAGFGLLAIAVAAAQADEPKTLAAYGKWRAMTVTADGEVSCYALSEPVGRRGDVEDRRQSGAMVTHFPAMGARDQVSVVLGFEPSKKKGVVVRIGGTTYRLTEIDGDRAWAKTLANDKALVQAMRKANRMTVTSATAKGQKVEDTYDLSGFTRAYQAMSRACS